ncbi:MAG: hypothetical protein Q7R33_05260 [Nitrosarchaeum sp.]|nr:hypothetical protein [Nitrosarchaeum sp.]
MIFLGKLLTKDDIKIFFYNSNHQLIDPFYVSYTVFDLTTGKQEIIRQTINSKPMRFDTGSYFVPLKLHPIIFRVGRHIVKWAFKQYDDSMLMRESQEFDITRPAEYAGEYCLSKYVKEVTIQ